MTYQISIPASGHQFSAKASDNLLESAIAAGVNLPYGCRNGTCGSCKGDILSGFVHHEDYAVGALTEA